MPRELVKHDFWVCLRLFLEEMSIQMGGLSPDPPHRCAASPNPWKPEQSRTVEGWDLLSA